MIKVTQTCDSCSESREIPSVKDEDSFGWRRVRNGVGSHPDKHLCVACINAMLSPARATTEGKSDE